MNYIDNNGPDDKAVAEASKAAPSISLAAAVFLIVLSSYLSAVTVRSYGYADGRLLTYSALLCISCALYSFLLVHFRNPAVLISPAAAFAIPVFLGSDVLLAVQAASIILIISAAVSLAVLKRAPSFKLLILTAVLLFFAYAVSAAVSLENSFGSVAGGLSSIKAVFLTNFSEALAAVPTAESLTATVGGRLDLFIDYLVVMAPAALMSASLVLAWFLLFLFKSASRIFGTFGLLFEKGRIPKAFAVFYILIAVISFFSSSLAGPVSVAALNLQYVFMIMFAGVGLREVFLKFSRIKSSFAKTTITCFAICAAVFLQYAVIICIPIILPLISYYGAYRTLRFGAEGR